MAKGGKVLYRKASHPDNHVPTDFLCDLEVNGQRRPPTLAARMYSSIAVCQQLSAAAIFLVVSSHAANGSLSSFILLLVDLILLALGLAGAAAVAIIASSAPPPPGILRTARSLSLFVALLRVAAPVLRTLTVSVADDSIQALSVALLALHLFTHEYGRGSSIEHIEAAEATGSSLSQWDGAVSLNASMFATALVGSRLDSNLMVFSLTLLSVELFALLPLARRMLLCYLRPVWNVVTTVIFSLTALILVATTSVNLAFLFGFCILAVALLAPLALMRLHKYKLHIATD